MEDVGFGLMARAVAVTDLIIQNLTLDKQKTAQEELVESVEDAGFDGRLLGPGAERGTARLHVDGMICSACRCARTSQLVVVSAPLLLLQGAAACCAVAHMACSFALCAELYLAFKPPT